MIFRWLLWIATLVFGASMASIFATIFSVPSELKVKATSRATSAFISMYNHNNVILVWSGILYYIAIMINVVGFK